MEIIEKLIAIQKELNVPKNHHNPFGDFKYRTCEDIVEASKPICHKHGCALTLSDKMIEVCGMPYVESTATLSDGKDNIQVFASARETMEKKKFDNSQLTGSASSYARKYALNGLFAIDDTKDADTMDNRESANTSAKKESKKEQSFIERCNHAKNLFNKVKNGPEKFDEIMGSYQAKKFEDVPKDHQEEFISDLQREYNKIK